MDQEKQAQKITMRGGDTVLVHMSGTKLWLYITYRQLAAFVTGALVGSIFTILLVL